MLDLHKNINHRCQEIERMMDCKTTKFIQPCGERSTVTDSSSCKDTSGQFDDARVEWDEEV